MIRKILFSVLVLLFCCILFFAQLMGSDRKREARVQPTSLPAIGTVSAQQLGMLTQAFGGEIPCASLPGEGSVTDTQTGSLRARLLTWRDSSGAVITAVRPAEAASVLRREELQLRADSTWSLEGRTLLLAEGGIGASAYYSDSDAAYSIFLPDADGDALLTFIVSQLHFPTE